MRRGNGDLRFQIKNFRFQRNESGNGERRKAMVTLGYSRKDTARQSRNQILAQRTQAGVAGNPKSEIRNPTRCDLPRRCASTAGGATARREQIRTNGNAQNSKTGRKEFRRGLRASWNTAKAGDECRVFGRDQPQKGAKDTKGKTAYERTGRSSR